MAVFKFEGYTIEEMEAHVTSAEQDLAAANEDVIEQAKEIAKAAKKGDVAKIRHSNNMLTRAFARVETREGYLQEYKERLEIAKRHESGFGPILEFLEEMFKMDLSWHKKMREEHSGKTFSELMKTVTDGNKTVAYLIKMSEAEAEKTFRADKEMRFVKIKQQIEAKVGNVVEFDLDRNYNNSLDGYVIGDKATAAINTIVAGGYNIQRAHYRTLVKVEK